ncbi:PPC domain-containing DNA-binding protein [Marispirochaeta sp.]|uniref:PPC domain-containing DNA-binding protein n=1 Tax=Marispirochaeta sp. TaxID=2038653 RepID=UPI0029C683D5|nr:PPC domain-containing DNA-binding protein [Marispirochaeta sp.]
MKDFIGKPGRTVILELQRGEKLLESVREYMAQRGIKNAILSSAVGSLMRLIVHKPTGIDAAAVDEFETIEDAMEVCSLTGSVIGGEPHFHIVASGVKGLYAGHVEPDTEVLYLLELTFTEVTGLELERKRTPENVKKIFAVT